MAPIRSSDPFSTANCCIQRTVLEDGIYVTRFFCKLCDSSVKRKADFQRHMRTHSAQGLFFCTWAECTHTHGFPQKSNMDQHIKSVHLGMRYDCPHSYVSADGTVYPCDHLASDPSGLVRHRSTSHGWDAGDDPAKITVPTPEGATFPNSKYYRGDNKKRKVDERDGESAKGRTRSQKRSKTMPASSSSNPAPSSSRSTPSSSRTAQKKPRRRASAPVRTQKQDIDTSSMHTSAASQSSTPSPITVADWDLGLGKVQSQPATGMDVADPLRLLSSPAPLDDLEALFQSEAQTTAVDNWSLSPQLADFNFNFTASALPLPGFDGTINPSMLTLPAPIMSPTPQQKSLANAGFASSPGFFDPSLAEGLMTMGWRDYPTPGSSRESTASPDFGVFDDAPLCMSVPAAREPVYDGCFVW
uniref:N/A n=1 Tax=Ganoderma boninense TaxID=34458 RepID=A0A5K1JU88_9APHY|nr:N/A [Ganoderma boninense]